MNSVAGITADFSEPAESQTQNMKGNRDKEKRIAAIPRRQSKEMIPDGGNLAGLNTIAA